MEAHHMDRAEEKALLNVYDQGKFSVGRRAFVALAAASGVTAMGGALLAPSAARMARAAESTAAASGTGLPQLEDGKVRFTVHSDIHVGASCSFFTRDKIAHAFERMYSMADAYDAHFLVGDTVEHAFDSEYADLVELLNANATSPLGITMGNHECYHQGDDGEASRADFSANLLANLTVPGSFQAPGGVADGEPDFDVVVGADLDPKGNGYHVIGLSAHSEGNEYYEYYGDRKDWIRERLAADAEEGGADTPIFMLIHHPFDSTVRRTATTGSSAEFGDDPATASNADHTFYDEICAAYPQLIVFCGHTHTPLQDPFTIYQDDGITVINTATFAKGYYEYDWGIDEGGAEVADSTPVGGADASEGVLVEIDPATNAVTVTRLDFRGEGSVIGTPWVIDVAQGASAYAYRLADRQAAAKEPLVSGDGNAALGFFTARAVSKWGDSTSAYFSIDTTAVEADTTGAEDDVITAYRVQVAPADASSSTGEALYDATYISDYFKTATAQDPTFVRQLFGIELSEGADYVMTVSAISAYGVEAEIGQVEFTCDAEIVAPAES